MGLEPTNSAPESGRMGDGEETRETRDRCTKHKAVVGRTGGGQGAEGREQTVEAHSRATEHRAKWASGQIGK